MSGAGPNGVRGAYATLAWLLLVWLGAALTARPPAAPDAPAHGDEPDVGRARAHVARIAAEPHPSGTPANDAVRAYLVDELRALGLEPEPRPALVPASSGVRDLGWLEPAEGAPDVPRDDRGRPLVSIESLVARIRGTGDGGAVLLQAHFDSRRGAPGAGDDAAGVAAVLETLRLLSAGAPLRNDLIVHLDDGEELGLLGAREFAAHDPWRDDVRCVINLDARGNAGTPIAFEVGRGSAPLLRAFARSHARPVAPSLAAAVYRRMPNDTSFSPFRDLGIAGLNFAFVGGGSAYHRPWDSPDNLSQRTLQRLCEYTLGITRTALELDLHELGGGAGGEAVSFNAGLGGLVVYPRWWSYPLLVPPLALLALALVRARRRGLSAPVGVAHALGLAVLVVVGSAAAWWAARGVAGAAAGLGLFAGEPRGNLASGMLGGLGAFGVGLALAIAYLGRLRAEAARRLELIGACACAVLLVALTLALPEGGYLVGWPLTLALPALVATAGSAHPERIGLAPRLLGLAAYAAAATILAPIFLLLVQVVAIRPARIPLLAGAFAVLVALLFARELRGCAPRAVGGPALLAAVASGVALALGAVAAATGL